MDEVPVIYAYIYRSIKNNSNNSIVSIDTARISLRRVLIKCPSSFYREIFSEMCSMGLLKQINRDNYVILNDRKIYLRLKRKLKDYIFPLT